MKMKQIILVSALSLVASTGFSSPHSLSGVYACQYQNKGDGHVLAKAMLKKTGQNDGVTIYSGDWSWPVSNSPYSDHSTLFVRGNVGVTSFIGKTKDRFVVGTSTVKISKDGTLTYKASNQALKKDGQLAHKNFLIVCKKAKA